MGAMRSGGGNGAAAAGFTNFSSVNVMLKASKLFWHFFENTQKCNSQGFMELQKEQLEVEKAKAEASRAKVNLALEQEYDYEGDASEDSSRQKRSAKCRF